MFQFPGFASPAYGFSGRYRRSGGLPHSEIHGSKPARGSPWLIATCCVLHRLSVPRHPPDALQTLDLNDECATRRRKPTRTNHQPATASGKDASHDPTDCPPQSLRRRPCRVILGHKVLHMSKIPYPPRRISVFSLADISSLAPGGKRLPGHQRSLSVTVRSPWWRRTGSNRRPHACKARALPTELRPLIRKQASGCFLTPDFWGLTSGDGGPGKT